MRSGEKHILGESTLTCGEEREECGDRPEAGEKMSWSWSSQEDADRRWPTPPPPAAAAAAAEEEEEPCPPVIPPGVTVEPEDAEAETACGLTTSGVGCSLPPLPLPPPALLPPERYRSRSKESNLKTACWRPPTTPLTPDSPEPDRLTTPWKKIISVTCRASCFPYKFKSSGSGMILYEQLSVHTCLLWVACR